MQIAEPAGEMGTQRGNSGDKCAGSGGGPGRAHSSGSFFCLLLADLWGLLSTKGTLRGLVASRLGRPFKILN